MCQFSNKTDNSDFLGPNLPKNGYWSWNFKNLSLDSESAPPRYHMCQFSVKMDNFEFFSLNLRKLTNYVQCFGSNIVEGVVESWVEAEISWVEVGAWFSNTHSESFQEIPRKSFTARCIFKAHNVEGVAWMEVDGAGWS